MILLSKIDVENNLAYNVWARLNKGCSLAGSSLAVALLIGHRTQAKISKSQTQVQPICKIYTPHRYKYYI